MVTSKSSRPGLYANIQAKRERIAHGSGERMREPGDAGAPSAEDFRDAARTARTAKASRSPRGSAKRKEKST